MVHVMVMKLSVVIEICILGVFVGFTLSDVDFADITLYGSRKRASSSRPHLED